jgi:hypothetical protein
MVSGIYYTLGPDGFRNILYSGPDGLGIIKYTWTKYMYCTLGPEGLRNTTYSWTTLLQEILYT